jgi:hypothetical protein
MRAGTVLEYSKRFTASDTTAKPKENYMTTKKKVSSPNRKPDRKRLERTVTGAANKTRISQVGTVFVPVGNQDRALEFYLDKVGLH